MKTIGAETSSSGTTSKGSRTVRPLVPLVVSRWHTRVYRPGDTSVSGICTSRFTRPLRSARDVSITDAHGAVISWCTAGRAGFKGSRKSTAFAATLVAQDAARQAVGRGMHEVEVEVQGAGAGRESAIRGLQSAGLTITVIKDVTPIPHNGCRARKRRRV